MTAPVQTFYSQIAANRRQSLLLVVLITLFLGFFGFVIGYAISGGYWQGGVFATGIAVLIAFLLSSFSYFGGDSLVLTTAGARELNEQSAPQLMNVVRELTIAADIPMPRVYAINDTAPTGDRWNLSLIEIVPR